MKESAGRHTNVAPEAGSLQFHWDNLRWSAKRWVSDAPPEDEPLLELPPEEGYFAGCRELWQLSYQQRLTAFFMSLGIGVLFIVFAVLSAPAVVVMPKKFAFFLTVGNIFCLMSTVFLVGISYQFRVMFEANRLVAASFYSGSVVLTLVCALWLQTSTGCIIFAVVQVVCLLWYALSFIPYARYTVGFLWSSIMTIVGPLMSGLGKCLLAIFE